MVVGHYGCGGVRAAFENADNGLIDNWLRNIKDVLFRHQAQINALDDVDQQVDRLCELNVMAQVEHVAHTTIVQNAWQRGQELAVHGWVYSLKDGLLQDLCCTIDSGAMLPDAYRIDA
jgi:carbonic anhydrase